MNQAWSHKHFPVVLPEKVERDRERRIPIDPLRIAVWGTFFAAIFIFWAFIVWAVIG
jgi:hypothetical protein